MVVPLAVMRCHHPEIATVMETHPIKSNGAIKSTEIHSVLIPLLITLVF